MNARCKTCGHGWESFVECHCTTCCHHFSNIGSFDAHRKGPVDNRHCDTSGLVEVRPGVLGRARRESGSFPRRRESQ